MKSRRKNDLKTSKTSFIGSQADKSERVKQISVLPLFPAAPQPSRSTKTRFVGLRSDLTLHNAEDIIMTPCNTIIIQTTIDGKVQISRTQKEREKNPDRLSLDRRGLSKFPILIGEIKLRLLSLQHNILTNLEKTALLCLPHLVFLDIYNNQLENMSALQCLHHLRVLLLGKNRIKIIDGLSNMGRLEVLDLHGNQIVQISNLRNQKELKVLNLASNQIQCISQNDLVGLNTLQELNLRRNCIKTLCGFEETPQILKLFLSNNCIATNEDLNGIRKLQYLKEITLEGNPVRSNDNCVFFVVSYIPSVQLFGQTKITEDIRRVSKVWRLRKDFKENKDSVFDMEAADSNSIKQRVHSTCRTRVKQLCKRECKELKSSNKSMSAENASKCSMLTKSGKARRVAFIKDKTISVDSCYGSETSGEYFRLPPIITSSISDDGRMMMLRVDPNTSMESNKSLCSLRDENASSSSDQQNSTSSESDEDNPVLVAQSQKLNTAHTKPERIRQMPLKKDRNVERDTRFTKPVTSSNGKTKPTLLNEKTKEQGSDFLVQICGRYLTVTGRSSAKYIDKAWNVDKACDVTTVKFICVSFNSLVPVFNRLKYRFPNAKHFVFSENDFNYVGQLNAFTDLGGMVSLEVHAERNSVVTKNWRSYAIFRLHHWGLQIINNKPITEDEVNQAKEEYHGLGELVLFSLPESLLTPLLSKLRLEISNTSAKEWLCQVDPVIRGVICKEALKWRSPASLSQADHSEREKGRQNLMAALEKTCAIVLKLKMLENEWDSILYDLVKSILNDYNDMKENTTRK